jgi:tetratricopeptide (TPR) repeat protein
MQQKNSSDNAAGEDLAALSRQALQHFKEGRLQQAQDVCQRILQKKKHSGALLILGWIAHQQHEFEEAVERYQQYLGVKPKDAEAHFTLGLALRDMGRAEAAIEHYRKSITIAADNAAVHGQLGDAYTKLQRWEDAIKAYQKVLTINADDVV